MQNNENNMDQLFQSKLDGFEVAPPPEVWDNIAASLGHKRKRRAALLIWSLSGAAALVIAFLLGLNIARENDSYDEFYAARNQFKREQGQQHIIKTEINQNIIFNKEVPQFASIVEVKRNFTDEKELVKSRKVNAVEKFLSLAPTEFAYLQSAFNEGGLMGVNNDKLSDEDRAIIEANLLAMNSSSKNDESGNWAIGVQATPLYHFDKPAVGEFDAAPMYGAANNSVYSNYKANVSGGVSFAYETSNRLTFITGVNYAEVGQQTNAMGVSFAGYDWSNNRGEMDYLASDGPEEAINSVSNNVVLNTDVGLANINLPPGVMLSSASKNSIVAPTATQNYEYEQAAGYIEIPTMLKYKLIDKRLGLHLLGGFSTNLLVSNSVQLSNKEMVVANGKIEGLRPITFSTNLGMGMNYDISEKFTVNLEPTLKINMNTLNAQQNFNAQPYGFGLFSGVTYQF